MLGSVDDERIDRGREIGRQAETAAERGVDRAQITRLPSSASAASASWTDPAGMRTIRLATAAQRRRFDPRLRQPLQPTGPREDRSRDNDKRRALGNFVIAASDSSRGGRRPQSLPRLPQTERRPVGSRRASRPSAARRASLSPSTARSPSRASGAPATSGKPGGGRRENRRRAHQGSGVH